MGMRRTWGVAVGTLTLAIALAACGGTGGAEEAGGAAGAVPADELLAELLLTTEDLDGDWVTDSVFTEWPDGQPGVVPEDQRGRMPTIDLCDAASEESRAVAEDLEWQVFTQVNMDVPAVTRGTEGQTGNIVAVQEGMIANEVAVIETAFNALRDGLEACAGVPVEVEEGTVTSEVIDVGEAGDDRIAIRSEVEEGGGGGVVVWTTNRVIGRTGTVLWYMNVMEIIAGEGTDAVLSPDSIREIISTAAEKIG